MSPARPHATATWSAQALAPVAALLMLACGGSGQVVQPPSGLSYPEWIGEEGVTMAPLAPTVAGPVKLYVVDRALPEGLRLDPATGVISGVPTRPAPVADYFVWATNEAGRADAILRLGVAGRLPDLRFQWVGAFGSYRWGGDFLTLGTPPDGGGGILFSYTGAFHWGPLSLASVTGDGWDCYGFAPEVPVVGGTTSEYTADHLEALEAKVVAWSAKGRLVSSFDASVRGFASVVIAPTGDETAYGLVRGAAADLDALAAWCEAQGRQGAVVTAVSLGGKQAGSLPALGPYLAFAATRRGDGRTFETRLTAGTPEELATTLPDLGLLGFRVTAFGTGEAGRYVAILTRPTGDTTPHDLRYRAPGSQAATGMDAGYAPVGKMRDSATGLISWFFQR